MNNIPQIRFPEFKNDGEWQKYNIGIKFNLQDGFAFSSYDFIENNKGAKQVIRITDINNKNENENKVFISEEYLENNNLDNFLVKKGELVLSLTGAAGFNYFLWNSEDAYINQRTMKISAKKEKDSFLVKLLEPLTHTTINKLGTGQNNNLSKEQMKDVEFLSPLPDEQQKIADCLSSLDEVITGYEEKLKAIQNHKKGLMQNLFPQEGKSVPNYRFPEFKNDGDWEERNFDSIATFLKGKGISKADIVDNGKTPCIRYGELYTTYKETIDKVVSYTDIPVKDLVFSKANDVIIPSSGETQLDIATASCVLNDNIALGGDLNIIRSINNGVFLSYYLNNAKKYEIARMAQGNAVVHLYPHQLKTLNLQLPEINEWSS